MYMVKFCSYVFGVPMMAINNKIEKKWPRQVSRFTILFHSETSEDNEQSSKNVEVSHLYHPRFFEMNRVLYYYLLPT